ncbi:hypothetical protein EI94DRAFT_1760487 [Lactarius quietus]|nr:hypothetical protein EI94DRAFT_1760487 [Lactarius quietus]
MMLHSWFYATAYTWQLTSQPSQCQPPYSLLLVPSVRTVQNIPFPGNSTSLTFNLDYPANSSFVAVVSDSSGLGSGGVSSPVTVLPSSTRVVIIPLKPSTPPGRITQCDSVRWWWLPGAVNGTVNFHGVIPGGNFFAIPEGSLTTDNTTGTGFEWTIDIAGGTNIIIVAGDDRGIGSGGSSYPTSTGGRSNDRSGNPRECNTGAIAGGVAGGLALMVSVALIAFFYARRRGYSAISTERPVMVLHDYEDGDGSYQDHPHHYVLEPYRVSDINAGGPSVAASTSDRLLSTTSANIPSPQTSASTNTVTTHKSGLPPRLRPVNIVQHNDAGPSGVPSGAGEHETIELPPAYTNIGSVQSPHGLY